MFSFNYDKPTLFYCLLLITYKRLILIYAKIAIGKNNEKLVPPAEYKIKDEERKYLARPEEVYGGTTDIPELGEIGSKNLILVSNGRLANYFLIVSF